MTAAMGIAAHGVVEEYVLPNNDNTQHQTRSIARFDRLERELIGGIALAVVGSLILLSAPLPWEKKNEQKPEKSTSRNPRSPAKA